MTKIETVVFDAYGTLFDIGSLDELLNMHFGARAGAVGATWRRKQLEYTWLRTLMGQYRHFSELTADALVYACNAHQVKLDDHISAQLLGEYLNLPAYPEVPEVLSQLGARVPLGVLSNADQTMLRGAIQRNNLDHRFQHVLSVEEIKLFKPRPEVYQMACQAFDLEPSQILFVSSNTWDVSGAKSFGLRVAWLRRFGNVGEQLGFTPDIQCDDMESLLTEFTTQ